MVITYFLIALLTYIVILTQHINKYSFTVSIKEIFDGAYSDIIIYALFWFISIPIYFLKKKNLIPFKHYLDKLLTYPIIKRKIN